MEARKGHPRRRLGWGLALALFAVVAGVTASSGAGIHLAQGPLSRSGDDAKDDETDVAPTSTTTGDSGPDVRAITRLLRSYDQVYANIVGNRDVLYNPNAEDHQRIASLLTPDSPLLPTRIYGGTPDLGDPAALRSAQVPGGQLNGRSLAPGERNARLPVFHELLSVPSERRDEVSVPVCVHLDWVIRPEGERPPWIQSVSDAEIDGEVVIRREGEAWRIHDWRLTGHLFGPTPDDRCTGRCGPDPAETAVRSARWGPTGIDGDGDGYEDWANGPPPADPACRTD